MTDAELIEMIQTKTPAELSFEEIEELRRRLEESAELRAALAENLEMERFLVGVLKPSTLSADRILARAARSNGVFHGRTAPAWGWALGLLLVGVAGFFCLRLANRSEKGPVEVEAPAEAAETAANDGAPKPAESPEQAEPAAEPPPAAKAKIETAARPPRAVPKKKTETLAVVGGPFGYLDVVGTGKGDMSVAELRHWLGDVKDHPVSFKNAEIVHVSKYKHRRTTTTLASHVEVNGLCRLNVPWKPKTALRLALRDYPEMKLHFWNGAEGITLQTFPVNHPSGSKCQTWTAYKTTRAGTGPRPATLALAADDDERYWRSNPYALPQPAAVAATIVELRHEQGLLTLSSGDARLLSVACAVPPQEVYWEGKGVFQQIALVTASPLPAEPAPRPIVVDVANPAEMLWLPAPETAGTFQTLPDGAVELQASTGDRMARAAVPISFPGPCEIIVELEGVKPDTGVYLGDDRGEVRRAVGFFRDKMTGFTVVAPPGDLNAAGKREIASAGAAPFVGEKLWLRLLCACGSLKCWAGTDGVTWARAFDVDNQPPTALGSFGLFCLPKQKGTIRLRRFILRELKELNALAPRELVRQAPLLLPAPNAAPSDWLRLAESARPQGVTPDSWNHACALRVLAQGDMGTLGAALVEKAIDEVLNQPIPWTDKLRFLDEALLLVPRCDAATSRRLCQYYERVGDMAYLAGEKRPYSRVARRAQTAPLWSYQVHEYLPDALIRTELLELAFAGEWEELYQLCRRVKLYQRARPNPKPLLDWGEALASQKLAAKLLSAPVPFLNQWRPPIHAEVNKEGSTVLAEIDAVLDGKAFRDAGRIIVKIGADETPGLLLTAKDPELLLSWRVAIGLLMREQPPLRTTLIEQSGAESRLTLRQALNTGDESALELLTLHYHGTAAAAEAHGELGDRALLAGAAARALGHYRQALAAADEPLRQRLVPVAQVAAALCGRNLAGVPAVDVTFGGTHFTPAQWQDLIADLQCQHADAPRPLAATLSGRRAPLPSGFEVLARGRFEGPMGLNPEAVPPEFAQNGVDGVARQCAVAVDQKRMVVSNRFQVAAYDLSSSQLQWRTALQRDPARPRENPAYAYEYPLTPMRPLLAAGRVFVRRLPAEPGNERQRFAPVLVCLDDATGKLLWSTAWNVQKHVISDPVLIQGQLFVLTASFPEEGDGDLSLAIHDPSNGALLREVPLARMRDHWKAQRFCQVAALEDALLVTCGGVVLCADLTGKVRWLRQQVWVPPDVDGSWLAHSQEPPLVADGRCFISQPGVRCVSCLDPETGAVHWRAVLPAVERIAGLAEHRLIVQTTAGFVALESTTGKQLWRHDAQPLLAAQLCGIEGLLYARTEKAPSENSLRPCLVWVDLETGAATARWPLESLRHPNLRMGPLVVAGNRLWTFFGRAPNPDTVPERDILELVPKGKMLTPTRAGRNETP